MRLLYTAAILGYGFAIFIASIFSAKARAWRTGRNEEKETRIPDSIKGCIWMHCASLGEFEQGRPVLDGLRETYPDTPLLLTFFSPSGYEIRKGYGGVDHVAYLPLDTPANARKFIAAFEPQLVIFVKYEIWHNILAELRAHKIPTFLISSKLRTGQIYFRNWAGWFRRSLFGFRQIFTQDAESVKMLENIGIKNAQVSGDTRFDRVVKIAESQAPVPHLSAFCAGQLVLVAGSTWDTDEALLATFFREKRKEFPELRMVVVPHEIHENHVSRLEKLFHESVRYSRIDEGKLLSPVLIVDSIGLLSRLYQYGDIAYIGGGFGAGIHNTLEAAAYGIPVVFGPRYEKFNEAVALIENGGGIAIRNQEELNGTLTSMLSDETQRHFAGRTAKNYVNAQKGATEKILTETAKLIR